jgi:hypothetical protein
MQMAQMGDAEVGDLENEKRPDPRRDWRSETAPVLEKPDSGASLSAGSRT